MVLAVASPHVDILGHCTGRKVVGTGRPQSQFDPDIVFAACARFDTAVEINCRPERQDPPEELLELALDWDCRVSIDTDAHAPGQLEWQPYGCDKAAGWASSRIASSTRCPPTTSSPGPPPPHGLTQRLCTTLRAREIVPDSIPREREEHDLGGVGDEVGPDGSQRAASTLA